MNFVGKHYMTAEAIVVGFTISGVFTADPVPDGVAGFSETLEGKVVGKTTTSLTLKINGVVRTWKNYRAENPKNSVGKSLVIQVKNRFQKTSSVP
tara:strand:- start:89 stop:373 length:285 start_codon:yes stop_codon:yes gene_type:complete